jgi:hypothetical protein
MIIEITPINKKAHNRFRLWAFAMRAYASLAHSISVGAKKIEIKTNEGGLRL